MSSHRACPGRRWWLIMSPCALGAQRSVVVGGSDQHDSSTSARYISALVEHGAASCQSWLMLFKSQVPLAKGNAETSFPRAWRSHYPALISAMTHRFFQVVLVASTWLARPLCLVSLPMPVGWVFFGGCFGQTMLLIGCPELRINSFSQAVNRRHVVSCPPPPGD